MVEILIFGAPKTQAQQYISLLSTQKHIMFQSLIHVGIQKIQSL